MISTISEETNMELFGYIRTLVYRRLEVVPCGIDSRVAIIMMGVI